MVGMVAPVRISAEFAGYDWESHEPEAIAAFYHWLKNHPGGLVLDVGCSIGIFSVVALFADSEVEVVAFDSDLASLAACKRMCRHASGARLMLINGLLTNTSLTAQSMTDAAKETDSKLVAKGRFGSIGPTRYICLSDGEARHIPYHRLDDLLEAEALETRPALMKCDVEGAEMLVLLGAESFLRKSRPTLLLSVHPPALQNYGHTKEQIKKYLVKLGYDVEVLSVDHEEHWWCEHVQLFKKNSK